MKIKTQLYATALVSTGMLCILSLLLFFFSSLRTEETDKVSLANSFQEEVTSALLLAHEYTSLKSSRAEKLLESKFARIGTIVNTSSDSLEIDEINDVFISLEKAFDSLKTIYHSYESLNQTNSSKEELERFLYLEEANITLLFSEAYKIRAIASRISQEAQMRADEFEKLGLKVVTGFSVLLTIIISLSILSVTKRIRSSLNHLEETVTAMKSGDLSKPVAELGGDEFGNLARAFEDMRIIRQRDEEKLRQLAAYLQNTNEDYRKEIAREIHDDVGQTLTAVKMDLGWLQKRLNSDQEQLVSKIEETRILINQSAQTVRRLCSELRPGILDDLGLTPALMWYIEQFSQRTGLHCDLVISPEEFTVENHLATTIYRIFQESLTNVARHAQAENILASLDKENTKIKLIIKDDGIGIAYDKMAKNNSFGILGMRERVRVHDGTFSITSKQGTGTVMTAVFPLNSKP